MDDPTDSYNVTAEADRAHDDQWLADKIVALGVITKDAFRHDMYSLQSTDGQFVGIRHEAREIVRDWRVAGALMEKMPDGEVTIWQQKYEDDSPVWIVETHLNNADGRDESLPRAINEACVEALSD